MVRSMFSGVSALRAHQLRLDVIGNNLANVLTVGYKGSFTTFQDLYSQNLRGASSSTESRGGTNPSQVGLGAAVSAVTVSHVMGSVQRTDVPEHLMIDGNGFFVVSSDGAGQNKFYTRAGNFQLDELGFLVTTEGMKVLDIDGKPIQIDKNDTESATATKHLTFSGNINKDGGDYTTNFDIYDSLGSVHTLYATFKGPALTNVGYSPEDAGVEDGVNYDPLKGDPDFPTAQRRYSYKQIVFHDKDGVAATLSPALGGTGKLYAKFNEKGDFVDIVTLDADTAVANSTSYKGKFVMKVPGADDIELAVDRSMFFKNADVKGGVRTVTQVAKESDVKGVQLYGISAGKLTAFEISSKGEVTSKYSNGQTKVTQVIALADFDNPTGLSRVGSNLFTVTPNSGTPKYGTPQSGSFGGVLSGALEMSNVDIGAQFTDLILTQRGLQANSRVITTSDEVLQELVNLKR